MAESLGEKVAIVTGGGSGIGEAPCRELARPGARVVVADINVDDAGQVATAIAEDDGQPTASTVDVAREQDVSRLVEHTAATRGRLDYLFNNAGIAIGGDARDLTPGPPASRAGRWLVRRPARHARRLPHHGQAGVRPHCGHLVGGRVLRRPRAMPRTARPSTWWGCPVTAPGERRPGVKVSRVCPRLVRTNIYQNAQAAGVTLPVGVPREQDAGAPAKMMAPSRAAQVILDGVARDKALIVFPASVRWARRANYFFLGLSDRILVRHERQLRRYRTAAPMAP